MTENNVFTFSAKEKRVRHYETTVVVSPALSDAASKEIAERCVKTLTDTKATILRKDSWGKKRMAHPMEKHGMGLYLHYRYVGGNDSVQALERTLKLDDEVLRFITVRLSEPLSQKEIDQLVERAPREESSAPSLRAEDHEMAFDNYA